jgi:hypothetical protein
LAGDDLLIRGSVADDKALRDPPRSATTASSPKGEPPDQAAGQTDKHIDAVPDLVERVRNEISKSLSRFSQRVSRVEVHLSDQNADRGGNEFGTSRATGSCAGGHSGEVASR